MGRYFSDGSGTEQVRKFGYLAFMGEEINLVTLADLPPACDEK